MNLFLNLKSKINDWVSQNPCLKQEIAKVCKIEENKIINSIVFNDALNKINLTNVRLIVIGDNPGFHEQESNTYLSGNAGKIIRNLIQENLELNIEESVVFLNKTPIFTKSTMQLSELTGFDSLITESQKYMASLVAQLHLITDSDVYIIGKSNIERSNSLFNKFKESLNAAYESLPTEKKERIFLFNHTSYNHFELDFYKEYYNQVTTNNATYNSLIEFNRHLLSIIGKRNLNILFPKQKLTKT